MVTRMQFHSVWLQKDKTQTHGYTHCNLNEIFHSYAIEFLFENILCAFTHFGCCFFVSFCQLFSGGCINASPAGKRRIANGVEQQQFGDDSLFGISGKLSIANEGNGNNGFGRITPATTAITAIAIAACVLIISVFAIIIVVLQVRIFNSFHIKHIFRCFSTIGEMNHSLSALDAIDSLSFQPDFYSFYNNFAILCGIGETQND